MDIRRWARFAAGGIANTAVTYALYLALIRVISYQWAYLMAYAVGIVMAYVVNSALVFRTAMSLAGLFAYPLVYVAQYLIAAGLLAAAVEWAGLPVTLAPLAVIAAMIPVSYVLNRLALARSPGSGSPGPSR
jgi:putative flippase GtrA